MLLVRLAFWTAFIVAFAPGGHSIAPPQLGPYIEPFSHAQDSLRTGVARIRIELHQADIAAPSIRPLEGR